MFRPGRCLSLRLRGCENNRFLLCIDKMSVGSAEMTYGVLLVRIL